MLSGLESVLRALVAALVVVLGWVPIGSILGDGGDPTERSVSEAFGGLGLAVGGGAGAGIGDFLDAPVADGTDPESLDGAGSDDDPADGAAGRDEAKSSAGEANNAADRDDEELDDAGLDGTDVETLDDAERVFDDFEDLDDLILPDAFDDFEDLDDAIVGTVSGHPDADVADTAGGIAAVTAADTGGGRGNGGGGRSGGGGGGGGAGNGDGDGGGGGRNAATGGGTADAGAADRDCADFRSQEAAQNYFLAKGGSADTDVDGLDRNGDGQACEDFDYGGAGAGDGGGGGGRRAGTSRDAATGGGGGGGRDGGRSEGSDGRASGASTAGNDAGNGSDGNPRPEDRNCDDFNSQGRAQEYFEEQGGSATNNVAGLDDNGNGQACEDFAYEAGTGSGRANDGGAREGGRTDGDGADGGGGNGGGGRSASGGGGRNEAGGADDADSGEDRRSLVGGETARSDTGADVRDRTIIERSADGGSEIEIDRGGDNNRPVPRSRIAQPGEGRASSGTATDAQAGASGANPSAGAKRISRHEGCRTKREDDGAVSEAVREAVDTALAAQAGTRRSDGDRTDDARLEGGNCRPSDGEAGSSKDRRRD